jgi:Bacterial regulatory helix-turn-helix protein, lysR family
MDVNEMLVFARVALTGSFTTAAAELGKPKSTVSRKITELEARLKARLLNRWVARRVCCSGSVSRGQRLTVLPASNDGRRKSAQDLSGC